MGNQLTIDDSTAPVAPGKRDVANRSAKAAENYSGAQRGARSNEISPASENYIIIIMYTAHVGLCT